MLNGGNTFSTALAGMAAYLDKPMSGVDDAFSDYGYQGWTPGGNLPSRSFISDPMPDDQLSAITGNNGWNSRGFMRFGNGFGNGFGDPVGDTLRTIPKDPYGMTDYVTPFLRGGGMMGGGLSGGFIPLPLGAPVVLPQAQPTWSAPQATGGNSALDAGGGDGEDVDKADKADKDEPAVTEDIKEEAKTWLMNEEKNYGPDEAADLISRAETAADGKKAKFDKIMAAIPSKKLALTDDEKKGLSEEQITEKEGKLRENYYRDLGMVYAKHFRKIEGEKAQKEFVERTAFEPSSASEAAQKTAELQRAPREGGGLWQYEVTNNEAAGLPQHVYTDGRGNWYNADVRNDANKIDIEGDGPTINRSNPQATIDLKLKGSGETTTTGNDYAEVKYAGAIEEDGDEKFEVIRGEGATGTRLSGNAVSAAEPEASHVPQFIYRNFEGKWNELKDASKPNEKSSLKGEMVVEDGTPKVYFTPAKLVAKEGLEDECDFMKEMDNGLEAFNADVKVNEELEKEIVAGRAKAFEERWETAVPAKLKGKLKATYDPETKVAEITYKKADEDKWTALSDDEKTLFGIAFNALPKGRRYQFNGASMAGSNEIAALDKQIKGEIEGGGRAEKKAGVKKSDKKEATTAPAKPAEKPAASADKIKFNFEKSDGAAAAGDDYVEAEYAGIEEDGDEKFEVTKGAGKVGSGFAGSGAAEASPKFIYRNWEGRWNEGPDRDGDESMIEGNPEVNKNLESKIAKDRAAAFLERWDAAVPKELEQQLQASYDLETKLVKITHDATKAPKNGKARIDKKLLISAINALPDGAKFEFNGRDVDLGSDPFKALGKLVQRDINKLSGDAAKSRPVAAIPKAAPSTATPEKTEAVKTSSKEALAALDNLEDLNTGKLLSTASIFITQGLNLAASKLLGEVVKRQSRDPKVLLRAAEQYDRLKERYIAKTEGVSNADAERLANMAEKFAIRAVELRRTAGLITASLPATATPSAG